MITKEEYERKKLDLENELNCVKRDLEALDRVWTMFSGSKGSSSAKKKRRKLKKGSAAYLIKKALAVLPNEFTQAEAEKKVNVENPKSTLTRGAFYVGLKRLIDSEEIEIKDKGSGKRATIFRKQTHRVIDAQKLQKV